jgi:hypothetical protein
MRHDVPKRPGRVQLGYAKKQKSRAARSMLDRVVTCVRQMADDQVSYLRPILHAFLDTLAEQQALSWRSAIASTSSKSLIGKAKRNPKRAGHRRSRGSKHES